jgi:putative ABC transport system substrate-binding protein
MKRREFLCFVSGTAVFWPGLARAQQSQKPKFFRLGYLEPGASTDQTVHGLRRQFLLGMRDLGYIEGRDFKLEERYAAGRIEKLPELASELARIPVDIIAAGGEAPISAAKKATSTVPIVMLIAADPVGSGFVASLARPGGNITGMSSLTSDMSSKRMQHLKEMLPHASRVAVLWNPANVSKHVEWSDTEAAAKSLGLTLHSVEARTPGDIEVALASISQMRPDALLTLAESLTIAFRGRIASFALANRLPMVSAIREFAEAGGLATYGTSRPHLWRQSAVYVDKIMRGAKPADLPVEQPTRFELLINLNTAKAIGVDVAPTMLTRADEVIE